MGIVEDYGHALLQAREISPREKGLVRPRGLAIIFSDTRHRCPSHTLSLKILPLEQPTHHVYKPECPNRAPHADSSPPIEPLLYQLSAIQMTFTR